MRTLTFGIGVLVSLGLIAVSIAMNFRFSQLLGKSEIDGLIYGMASACGDVLKTFLPFAIVATWRSSRYATTLAATALWLIFSAYSLTSSLGFAAVNRSEVSSSKQFEIDQYRSLRRELATARKSLESLPKHRPVAAVEATLQGTRQHRRWQSSRGCQDATVADSRTFCKGYYNLKSELETAKTAAELKREIASLNGKLSGLGKTSAGGSADPQVTILKQISTYGDAHVKLALTILVSLFVEFGSGLGLYLVTSAYQTRPKDQEPSTGPAMDLLHTATPEDLDRQWLAESVVPKRKATITAASLYKNYITWSEAKSHRNLLTFSKFITWLTSEGYSVKQMVGGQMTVSDIRVSR